jgi:hypothetical protein
MMIQFVENSRLCGFLGPVSVTYVPKAAASKKECQSCALAVTAMKTMRANRN